MGSKGMEENSLTIFLLAKSSLNEISLRELVVRM
jgi:hypothetical protein